MTSKSILLSLFHNHLLSLRNEAFRNEVFKLSIHIQLFQIDTYIHIYITCVCCKGKHVSLDHPRYLIFV